LFLAHAAALSELYVLLATRADSIGLRLRGFAREGDAREPFRARERERALAPDALVELEDDTGRRLLAFVELDLGTMSRPRLRVKAAAYAVYAAVGAWADRHEFCPCLLFLTTTDARALSFLQALADQLRRAGRAGGSSPDSSFAAAACALAHAPERALLEPCWDDLSLAGGGRSLVDCLRAGRAPYERRLGRLEADRRARERALERLRSDATALRVHLREHRGAALTGWLHGFGEDGLMALDQLLGETGPPEPVEREALLALAHHLGDDLLDPYAGSPRAAPDDADAAAVERLVESRRERQR
jgi:hypothetical protein